MKMKGESEKVCLKLNIQKTKIMASGPLTSWETDGETVTDFIFGGAPKPVQMVTAAMKLKDSKASVYNAGDPGSIPGSRSSLKKEKATHSSTLA